MTGILNLCGNCDYASTAGYQLQSRPLVRPVFTSSFSLFPDKSVQDNRIVQGIVEYNFVLSGRCLKYTQKKRIIIEYIVDVSKKQMNKQCEKIMMSYNFNTRVPITLLKRQTYVFLNKSLKSKFCFHFRWRLVSNGVSQMYCTRFYLFFVE